jgi:hypothetical protein
MVAGAKNDDVLRKFAMPWIEDEHLTRHQAQPIPVRHAGFKGFVGGSDTMDYYHEMAAQQGQRMHPVHDTPAHIDDHLGHFITQHGSRADWEKGGGTLGPVALHHGVWATQSHVSRYHIKRYLNAPNDRAWYLHHHSDDEDSYEGYKHPLFVTHEGRLHVSEGHHRVAADLIRGKSHSLGWHFDLDKHPINYLSDLHRTPGGSLAWLPTDERCPDCEALAADAREKVSAH